MFGSPIAKCTIHPLLFIVISFWFCHSPFAIQIQLTVTFDRFYFGLEMCTHSQSVSALTANINTALNSMITIRIMCSAQPSIKQQIAMPLRNEINFWVYFMFSWNSKSKWQMLRLWKWLYHSRAKRTHEPKAMASSINSRALVHIRIR